MLGGQGTYVGLRSSGVSYNSGTQIFQANVTVQNLTALPLGTPDGSSVTGVYVFFHSGPTVTSGTGVVTVKNPDGTNGTFTGTNQVFFLYNEIVQPVQVSSAKTWQWNVPTTVSTFAFQVLVDAKTPEEHTVLRWRPQADGATFTAVWGVASNVAVAVASDGSVWSFDYLRPGRGWRGDQRPTGTTNSLNGVGGNG